MNREKILAIVLAAGVSSMASAASAAMIAQYNFDSVTYPVSGQTTASDLTPNGHDITWNKTLTTSTSNPFGQSGDNSINVTGGTGNAANNSTADIDLNSTKAFTLEGWVNPTATDQAALIGTVNGTTSVSSIITLQMNASGQADGLLRTNSINYEITSATPLVAGTWYYMALTFDGSNLALYLKSSADPTLTQVGTSLAVPNPKLSTTSNNIFRFANAGLHGALFDDIRLSDTALSDAQLGYHASFTAATVPEPASLSLLGLGGLFLLGRRKRA
jgi:hypothetical protein